MRGGTIDWYDSTGMSLISIHPPHAGRDIDASRLIDTRGISIHPPHAGRDIWRRLFRCTNLYFNPPSPCGEGRDARTMRRSILIFQSTLPMRGGTLYITVSTTPASNFNPPSPCGEGRTFVTCEIGQMDFNPPSPCGEGRRSSAFYIKS